MVDRQIHSMLKRARAREENRALAQEEKIGNNLCEISKL